VATRLGSTVLSYWVGPEATHIWVVVASGEVTSVRVDVTRRRLASLVRQTWTVTDRPKRGDEAAPVDPSPGSRQPGAERTGPAADESEAETPADGAAEAWSPRVRGPGLVTLGEGARVASQALYRLLVGPVEHLLPAPGSLRTIIPHRELFQLSFAALLDRSGTYLVERHALHYVPAGVVLQLTRPRADAPSSASRYLLVADPGALPHARNGSPLPPLPGMRREVASVARLLPAGRVMSLTGARAIEPNVRRFMNDRTVLHFATHGVVRADAPLESFLALDTGRLASSPAARRPAGARDRDATATLAASTADDGRLTSWEIYGLDLRADLVVLSACRTGVGKVSGDGVVDLARAFLYAGTPSVVATLWDVADEPAARLMPQFYRALGRPVDKARALRHAQLSLLRDLRAGKVHVASDTGQLTLPEHPALWASFILVGEP
jgi:CHAT domain-containing protein